MQTILSRYSESSSGGVQALVEFRTCPETGKKIVIGFKLMMFIVSAGQIGYNPDSHSYASVLWFNTNVVRAYFGFEPIIDAKHSNLHKFIFEPALCLEVQGLLALLAANGKPSLRLPKFALTNAEASARRFNAHEQQLVAFQMCSAVEGSQVFEHFTNENWEKIKLVLCANLNFDIVDKTKVLIAFQTADFTGKKSMSRLISLLTGKMWRKDDLVPRLLAQYAEGASIHDDGAIIMSEKDDGTNTHTHTTHTHTHTQTNSHAVSYPLLFISLTKKTKHALSLKHTLKIFKHSIILLARPVEKREKRGHGDSCALRSRQNVPSSHGFHHLAQVGRTRHLRRAPRGGKSHASRCRGPARPRR
jgi:hypothetical protein